MSIPFWVASDDVHQFKDYRFFELCEGQILPIMCKHVIPNHEIFALSNPFCVCDFLTLFVETLNACISHCMIGKFAETVSRSSSTTSSFWPSHME